MTSLCVGGGVSAPLTHRPRLMNKSSICTIWNTGHLGHQRRVKEDWKMKYWQSSWNRHMYLPLISLPSTKHMAVSTFKGVGEMWISGHLEKDGSQVWKNIANVCHELTQRVLELTDQTFKISKPNIHKEEKKKLSIMKQKNHKKRTMWKHQIWETYWLK